MKKSIGVLVILIFMCLIPNNVLSLSCGSFGGGRGNVIYEKYYKKYPLNIIKGLVLRVNKGSDRYKHAIVRVREVFKGDAPEVVTVYTGPWAGVKENMEYVFYSTDKEGKFVYSHCTSEYNEAPRHLSTIVLLEDLKKNDREYKESKLSAEELFEDYYSKAVKAKDSGDIYNEEKFLLKAFGLRANEYMSKEYELRPEDISLLHDFSFFIYKTANNHSNLQQFAFEFLAKIYDRNPSEYPEIGIIISKHYGWYLKYLNNLKGKLELDGPFTCQEPITVLKEKIEVILRKARAAFKDQDNQDGIRRVNTILNEDLQKYLSEVEENCSYWVDGVNTRL